MEPHESRSTSRQRHVVLRGGLVVDGSGAPARRADVEIRDGRITRVGTIERQADPHTVDVTDLVVAPGFIDIHTHYDAQVLWDPALNSSAQHGVTTVVMGNCGFTLAPTRVSDRSAIVHLLRVVEGMSAEVLETGIQWSFETFPEYIGALRSLPLSVNVGPLVGHDALRRYGMGDAAQERRATAEERDRLERLVRDAVRAGALGFSTDRSGAHVDASGRPVASMFADQEEVLGLCRAAAKAGAPMVELACGKDFEVEFQVEIAESTGIAVTPTALLSGLYSEGEIDRILRTADEADGAVLPQVTPRPRLHYLTLAVPFEWLRMSDGFADGLERSAVDLITMYQDSDWRERAIAGLTARGEKLLNTGVVAESRNHQELVGRSIAELARERSGTPFETLVDLSLADNLGTRFVYSMYNDDQRIVGNLLEDTRTILGLSDAGAHADRVFDANFPTYLLGHWVRELGAMSLEFAVWRLSGQIAWFLGLPDRGFIKAGYAADLVVFDPERIGSGLERRVHDLPAGGDRLVADSKGVEHMWVNGVPIRSHGVERSAAAGVVVSPAVGSGPLSSRKGLT